MPQPAYFTAEDVAERLGVHPETIRRAIRKKRLACYKLQSCIRITQEQLDAYLEKCLCPVQDPISPSSDPSEESGASSGGSETHVDEFRRARQTQRALDKASRTSPPALSVVPQN